MLIKIFILAILPIINSQYSVNLNYPHLLDNSYTNISTVLYDSGSGFYVGFKDRRFRDYSPDFATYTGKTLAYVI